MKIRDSGMPPEETWEGFFTSCEVLTRLSLTSACKDIIEFGCGYGTFTIPAARRIQGSVFAFDIDPQMVESTITMLDREGLTNANVSLRDFVSEGCGLYDESVSFAMLFNILHCEDPVALLCEAWRVLEPGGKLGVVHWRSDIETPRGPSLDIRPTPSDCTTWAREAGFVTTHQDAIELPPFHFGLIFVKQLESQFRP